MLLNDDERNLEMDEKEWAVHARQGDELAFNQLVSLHKRKLYSIAYSYLRNEADALDALQDSVCKAWLKKATLKDHDAFLPWITRILINGCIDDLKRKQRVLPKSEAEYEGTHEMMSIYRMDLEIALTHLKPIYRHVLTLKYYHDMTLSDIAKIMDRPEGTVKTWLHQALKQVKKQINKGGEPYYGASRELPVSRN